MSLRYNFYLQDLKAQHSADKQAFDLLVSNQKTLLEDAEDRKLLLEVHSFAWKASANLYL
jgi:hypothetical protein